MGATTHLRTNVDGLALAKGAGAASFPSAAAPAWRVGFGKAMRHLKGEDRSNTRSVKLGGDEVHLAMIADGHGGYEASSHVATHLFDHFVAAAAGDGSGCSLRRAGELACSRIHMELLSLEPQPWDWTSS